MFSISDDTMEITKIDNGYIVEYRIHNRCFEDYSPNYGKNEEEHKKVYCKDKKELKKLIDQVL